MRTVIAGAVLLMLASCSEGGGSNEPRTELPLAAPNNAHALVKDFVEVCSLALVDANKAIGEAGKRGWRPTADAAAAAVAGLSILEKEDADASRLQLNISTMAYPHMLTKNCMLMRLGGSEAVDLAPIGKIAGVKGETMAMPGPAGEGTRGLWSLIGPDGDVVAVSAFNSDSVVQMTMGTSKQVTPK